MTTRYARVKAVMAKIEGTYATDSVPTGAANAVECRTDVRFKPIQSIRVTRENIQAYMGHKQDLPVGATCSLEIDCELAGAGGAVDTVPAHDPLFRACGWAKTVNTGVSVAYNPISTGFESVTVYFNKDGVLNKLLGCRGSASFKLTPKGIPYVTFKLMGLYGGKSDTAITAQTKTAWKIPKPVNKANTPTFTLFTYAAKVYDFSFDMSNTTPYRNMVGQEDIIITDRAPTGSVELEDTLVAEKDFESLCNLATLGALQMIHGVGAGNVVQIDMPQVEIGDPDPGIQDGVNTQKLPLRITPSAGNDEVLVTFK